MNKKISVFIISQKMNVLLLKTNSKIYNPPYWSVINGGVEDNETFENAAIRETFEESGLKIRNLVYSGHTSKYEYPKGNLREKRIFIGTVDKEEVVLSEEHEAFKWVPLNNLQKVFSWTESKEVLEEVISKIKELFRKNENN